MYRRITPQVAWHPEVVPKQEGVTGDVTKVIETILLPLLGQYRLGA
jgi:hypothetical protein